MIDKENLRSTGKGSLYIETKEDSLVSSLVKNNILFTKKKGQKSKTLKKVYYLKRNKQPRFTFSELKT